MYMLQMHAQCAGRLFEILPEQAESAELIVEDVVSTLLLALFGKVEMDEVAIVFPSHSSKGQQACSIHIRAQCFGKLSSLPLCSEEDVKQALVQRASPLLKELFGPVNIDSITLSPSPRDDEHDPAYSQGMERWRSS